MAVRIKDLETLAEQYTTKRYVYKDLALDIGRTKLQTVGLQIPTPGTDIRASFDLEAISNSLINLFNTEKGQRFLFPEYGTNLKRFLFSPITVETGQQIGNSILNAIKTYEPRVKPQTINVIADPDQNTYEISAVVEVPVFQITTELGFVFDLKKQSFISLPVKNI
jgi:phage baseplate assembly protein W